jgi:EAL domain-containing protein (putative c-di-GMP-specific phosphodiesterase class I)
MQKKELEICELNLANDLTQGLRQGAFSIVLQPKVFLANRRVMGAEILSRWYHPRFGEIAPDVWVQMAESQGLMRELTEWLTHKALQSMHLEMQLAINVCPSVFDCQLIDFIAEKFSQAGVSPQLLELELTESVKPNCLSQLGEAVRYAQAFGFHVALDDFGVGFSSMNHLVELPVNTVKIDRSIVKKITYNHSAALVCKTLINLAHEVDARVVCEGVETEEQCEILSIMGADIAQGYLFGKPMPLELAALYLNSGPSSLYNRERSVN